MDEALFTATLHASDRSVPSDPDLLVRTGGNLRLSNFLLYQSAYTELVALDCLWPDFGEVELRQVTLSKSASKCQLVRLGTLVMG